MGKEVIIEIMGEETPEAADRFIAFVSELGVKHPDTRFPSEETMRMYLRGKEPLFYFVQNSRKKTIGVAVVNPFLRADGKRSAEGLYLVTARASDKKRPIGTMLLNQLQQEFDEIRLNVGMFGINKHHDGPDIPTLTHKLIRYYNVLGFVAADEEKPTRLLWNRNDLGN